MRTRKTLLTLALALGLGSCGDQPVATIPSPDGEGPSLNTVAQIIVTGGGTVQVGQTTTVSATAYDANGNTIPLAWFSFSSSNPSIAAITSGGNPVMVKGLSVGSTAIWASSGGVSHFVPITVVSPPVVTTVTITPSPITLTVGASTQPIARAFDQYGNQMSGTTRTWSSANSSIASVSSTGSVTGVASGSTSVQVTIDGVTATAPVTVGTHLSIDLTGPYFASSPGQYTWSVQALGGTGSYTYDWSIEAANPYSYTPSVGSGSSYSMWVDSSVSSYFIVHVVVTSGTETATAQIGVCNFNVSAMC